MAYAGVFIFILTIFALAQAVHYLQAGTNTSICGFICYQSNGLLHLKCRHMSSFLAECTNSRLEVKKDNERLILNHSTGCLQLTDVRKNDSCVYEIWFYGNSIKKMKSTSIKILDAVKILNITSNFSHVGSDTSLHVHFSGAEATVIWEVDEIAHPSRYRLVDSNKTLIIRGVKDEDRKRKFVVQVKNPISEDTLEYYLEIQVGKPTRNHLAMFFSPLTLIIVILLIGYQQKTAMKNESLIREPESQW
ncbi:uncharacterized protein RB166_020864 isoform 1-T2 [Leptodactylus fuscus]|uniref:uncharacterized protein LOC142184502 n=1 Tax=Leptodactylus fuscus TaxID=238119 RepID=UPI003F4E84C8